MYSAIARKEEETVSFENKFNMRTPYQLIFAKKKKEWEWFAACQWSPPVGSGQSPGGGPGDETSRISLTRKKEHVE